MHRVPVINPVAMRHLAEELHRRGENLDTLCRGMGFTAESFEAPEFRLSFRQVKMLVHRALRLVADPALGLHVGKRRTLVSSGLMGLAMATCPSIRRAATLLPSYQGALGSTLTMRLEDGAEGALCIVAEAPSLDKGIAAFLVDELFSSIVQLVRCTSGQHFKPQAIDLAYENPGHEPLIRDFFACPVRFGQAVHRLSIGAESLDAPLPSADAVTFQQITGMLNRELMEHEHSDICLTIERMVLARLKSPPKLEELAELLSTSVRTLRRKLAEQGTSYQALTDQIYQAKAEELLKTSNATVSDIADALGFSDVRNFRRAFKRWTGIAPTSLRK